VSRALWHRSNQLVLLPGQVRDFRQHRKSHHRPPFSARLRDIGGTSIWPVMQRAREHWLAAASTALGEETFRAAWSQGQALTSEQAIAYALEDAALPQFLARSPST